VVADAKRRAELPAPSHANPEARISHLRQKAKSRLLGGLDGPIGETHDQAVPSRLARRDLAAYYAVGAVGLFAVAVGAVSMGVFSAGVLALIAACLAGCWLSGVL
jgi:hypothetical protein